MATTVADVAVRVGADLGPLQRNMRKGGRSLDQFSRQAGQTAKKVAAITAAVGLASAAIGVRMVNATNKSIDAQAKLARQLDGTIDGLRAVQLAGSDAGVETSVLNAAMERLTSRLGEAMEGTGEAAKAIETLGLNAADLAGMDIDERMATIADRMETLGLSAAQAGNMLRDFGVRNGEVINLMRQGGDAIRNASVEVERFGLSLSEVDAAKVEAANDAMSRIGLASEGLRQSFAVELAPTIEAIAEQLQSDFVDAAGDMGEGISDAVDVGISSLADLMRGVAGVIRFVEGNEALKFGVLGAVILGPQGRLLGAAIGAAFGLIREEMQRFGLGLSDAEENGRDLAAIMTQIKEKTERLEDFDGRDFLPPVLAADAEALRIEIAELSAREAELTTEVEASSEATKVFNDLINGTASGANSAADALDRYADRLDRSREDAGGDDEEGQPQIAGLPTPEEMETRIGELMPLQMDYQNRSLTEYMSFLDRRVAATKDANEREKILTEQNRATMLHEASVGMGRLSALMETQHKGMFEVGKAAAISQTVIDTYAAAQSSYKALAGIPVVGPGLGAAAAAAAVAGGLARVSAISSRQMNTSGAGGNPGGGGDSSAASAGQQAQGGGQQQNVNLNLSLVGDSFSRSQVMGLGREMVDEINNALDDGAQLRVSGT